MDGLQSQINSNILMQGQGDIFSEVVRVGSDLYIPVTCHTIIYSSCLPCHSRMNSMMRYWWVPGADVYVVLTD